MASQISSVSNSNSNHSVDPFSASTSSSTALVSAATSAVAKRYFFSFSVRGQQEQNISGKNNKVYRVLVKGEQIDFLASQIPLSMQHILEKKPRNQEASSATSSDPMNTDSERGVELGKRERIELSKDKGEEPELETNGKRAKIDGNGIISGKKERDEVSNPKTISLKEVQLPENLFTPRTFRQFIAHFYAGTKIEFEGSIEELKAFIEGCQYFSEEELFKQAVEKLCSFHKYTPENEEYIFKKILEILAKEENREKYPAMFPLLIKLIYQNTNRYWALEEKHTQKVPEAVITFLLASNNVGLAEAAFNNLENKHRYPLAASLIGDYYRVKMKDNKKAIGFFTQSAAQGVARDQHTLGVLCLQGEMAGGLPAAIEWYKKAAAQNFRDAQYSLGALCYEGKMAGGLPTAIEWFEKAAARNLRDAQRALGILCEKGEMAGGIPAAIEWYKKAAAQNCANAQKAIGRLEANPRGIQSGPVGAAFSASTGFGRGQVPLGLGMMGLNSPVSVVSHAGPAGPSSRGLSSNGVPLNFFSGNTSNGNHQMQLRARNAGVALPADIVSSTLLTIKCNSWLEMSDY